MVKQTILSASILKSTQARFACITQRQVAIVY
jgi:hypothetical protein